MCSTKDVIESYKTFLEVKYPSHFQSYCRRMKAKIESVKAEAITFSILRSIFKDVQVAEDISTGGTDFLCKSNGNQFIFEVTCLEAESVAAQSGWRNEVSENVSAGFFRMITHMLRTKVSSKTMQLSGYSVPRTLVITCEHVAADVLLGTHGAELLLTSDTMIEVPIGKPIDTVDIVTDLKDSVFFRLKNGALESCRRSISAILLFSVLAKTTLAVGILHPDPEYKFPISLLPSVPFMRMKEWPPINNRIETEWVIDKPKAEEFYHREVELTDKELRSR
ncbi:MAG: hypothetical protein GX874_08950 [Smithella sp.]|jgi:hypothetical protein|nr:hypothetical protein [Smithellaceae bacterium]NLA41519.1 hypothetical protein [Smithella sp.]